jgi:5,10-methylene-tetrahydrofolate dehydrogenase/methenyl tetrahydrofolate cyclohydrolase
MEEMMILDGKEASQALQNDFLKPKCEEFKRNYHRAVGLAVVVVGTRKDSATYVRMKQKGCTEVGIASWKIQINLPEEPIDESKQKEILHEILSTISSLNHRVDVDGIIVQLPLPSFCDADAILASIHPSKDVDGLHPENHAALFGFASKKRGKSQTSDLNFSIPCTPAGCLELLDRYEIPLEGKDVVILGRSEIVGLPMALLCLQRNATVTVCHSRTKELQQKVKQADIVIAAVGRAQMVKGSWLKDGAVVIDVGINPLEDSSKKAGYRLVGDVDFEDVKQNGHVRAISPVPGGVGPMTVAMLLKNTLACAQRRVCLK